MPKWGLSGAGRAAGTTVVNGAKLSITVAKAVESDDTEDTGGLE